MYHVARSLSTDHKDLIHDVSYDFYGRRLATCSSDQSIKVWDLGDDGEWYMTANWKTHSGSVWRVTWAHPEFGQVIATCSFDRTAVIWEEHVGDKSFAERSQCHWIKRASFVDSRTSVTDVKFSPKHLGLQLATCSADGILRIYEAADVMNLSQWSLQHETNCKFTCSCISWSPARNHPPMIAVGSDDNTSNHAKVFIYEYSENTRRWVKVESLVTVSEPVHDVSFAPNGGRSYHLLAVASKDVKILILKPLENSSNIIAQTSMSQFEIRLGGQFNDHSTKVRRVSWNITGTILASSGDDGCVRLWKANYLDTWKCVSVLRGDGTLMPLGNIPRSSTSNENNSASSGPTKYYKLGQVTNPSQVPWH
ncbi:Nucleoporin SEH1 [Nymphon striatum]|nr:Nucleoporin SEH1 [Nymphon striatum]